MDHTVDVHYRFIFQGDTLSLEKGIFTPHHKMRQWVSVLSGHLGYEDVDGHHDGFTIQEMRMFIDQVDVLRKGRQ